MAGFELGAARAMNPMAQGIESQRGGAFGVGLDALRGPEGTSAGGSSGVGSVKEGSFAGFLQKAVGDLEASKAIADKKSLDLVMGHDVAVHDVMAAVTEAEIAVQMTAAVAVKAIQAYQEIWRMEI